VSQHCYRNVTLRQIWVSGDMPARLLAAPREVTCVVSVAGQAGSRHCGQADSAAETAS
jgi:hypothetical protein